MVNADRARRQQPIDILNCSGVLDTLEAGSTAGGFDNAVADIWQQKKGLVND